MLQEISLSTSKKQEFVDITLDINNIVKKSKIKEGICVVYCPHTTTGITINENADPSVKKDMIKKLSQLVPENDGYSHTEGNSDAHINSSILGNEKSIIIKNNELILGTWQGILFFEGDGPRKRRVLVKIIKS
ncbi:hypothetical protein CEE44_02390 [Candidatus Woesearchaeota archaeon B3_Woes]|nr:MAG: hypothetical protein CEE44_02390 [Candidatus Woesearchaeota archaeon B3_Woes]